MSRKKTTENKPNDGFWNEGVFKKLKKTFDYVKDDPCYGCRFALMKSQEMLEREGMFTRRFFCTNQCRLTERKMKLIKFVLEDNFTEALRMLNGIMDMCYERFMFKPSESLIRPWCYNPAETISIPKTKKCNQKEA